uniref:Lactate/malate dehydrogenase C-terminal domain-containing protein n=1 Tax=Capra hircus TaxID=9925 RepID=A0A452FPU2_CAPHI
MSEPIQVLVTRGAGPIAYSLLHSIGNGSVFGKGRPIILGGWMASQQIKKKLPSKTWMWPFLWAPCQEGMAWSGKIYSKSLVKALVVGNPANTNCLTISKSAPSIPKENFSCLTRLDHNQAKAQTALKLGVTSEDVKNVIIWGNHSSTQYPDVNHAKVKLQGKEVGVYEALKDDSWLKGEFIRHDAAITKAQKVPSTTSAARAIWDHVRHIWFGTPEGEFVSMGIISDGNSYGIPDDLLYSFPKVIEGLPINDFSCEKMDLTTKEEEKETAFEFLASA